MRRVRNLVAILVVVRKSAGDEFLPQIEVPQLDLRTKTDVSGEQTECWRVRQCLQVADQFPDAGTGSGFALRENVVEPEDIAFEEAPKMFGVRFDVVLPEKFAHQAHVGATGKLHFLRAVRDAEFRRKRFGKRLDAGAARVDERAVNVEENEFDHSTQSFDGGFEARDIRDVEHLRFFVDAFHEAGQGRAWAKFDEARVTLRQ